MAPGKNKQLDAVAKKVGLFTFDAPFTTASESASAFESPIKYTGLPVMVAFSSHAVGGRIGFERLPE